MSHLTLFSLTSGLLTGQVDPPPPYFLIVIQIYNFWYVFGKFLGSTSIICKKMSNLQKSKDLLRKLVIKQKCALCKEKLRKSQQIIHFWKFKCAKTCAKSLKPKCVFKKNWKCANSLLRRLCKNLCKISL